MRATPGSNTSDIPFRDSGEGAPTGGPDPRANAAPSTTLRAYNMNSVTPDSDTPDSTTLMVPALPGGKMAGLSPRTIIKALSKTTPKGLERSVSAGSTVYSSGSDKKRRRRMPRQGMLRTKLSEEGMGMGGSPLASAKTEMDMRHSEESHEQDIRHKEELHQFKVQDLQRKQDLTTGEGVAPEEMAPPPVPMEPEQEQGVLQNAMANLKDKQVQVGPLPGVGEEAEENPLEKNLRFL